MLPKISITEINKVLFEGVADKRVHIKNVLKADITKRNQFLQPLIDNGQTFDVVVIKEEAHSYTVIIKVSPGICNVISNHEDKLFVSMGRCDVSNIYHYKQCFHCQKLGHNQLNVFIKMNIPPACTVPRHIHLNNVLRKLKRNRINVRTA